jgi:hypothetical protein
LVEQAIEALLHEPVLKAEPPQVFNEPFGPFSYRFRYVDAIETKFGFDPVLHPYPITDQLPATANHLPVVALLLTRNEYAFEQALRKKMGQLAAILAVCFDAIPRLLGNQAGGSDHTINSVLKQAVMQPETETARFVHNLDGRAPIPLQKHPKYFPSSWNASTEQLNIRCSDGDMPAYLVQINPDKECFR